MKFLYRNVSGVGHVEVVSVELLEPPAEAGDPQKLLRNISISGLRNGDRHVGERKEVRRAEHLWGGGGCEIKSEKKKKKGANLVS